MADSPLNITDTGIKGFLKWLQVAQPGIYQEAAPKIAAALPQAFSDYHAGGWRSFSGLGDASDPTATFQTTTFDASDVGTPPTVDVSDAANTGAGSGSLTDTIAAIVNGIAQIKMTNTAAQITSQVVNTQLNRAAAGLPPLPITTGNGVPVIQPTTVGGSFANFASQNPVIVFGGLGLLLLMLAKGARR